MSTLRIILESSIILSIISQCVSTSGRKYDLDQEAYKLYGEDFKAVLRRFRKTPDYLKILNDKMNELKVYVKEMSFQVLHYYYGKMKQRVNDIIGITMQYEDTTTTTTTTTTPIPALYYHAAYARRQEEAEPDRTGVKRLDEYSAFYRLLSVTERNSFRDLGFEFAGNLIHSIIHNMGPVTETPPPRSTRLPFGGDPEKSTTSTSEHPQKHEVTGAIQSTLANVEDQHPPQEPEPTPDTFRFRYHPQS